MPKRGNDPLFASDAFGKRIDAVAHGALMHLPRKDWSRPAASFDRTRLGQIRTAMTSWVGAHSLSDAAFGQNLVDATTSGVTISALRAAARAAQAATSHQDLQDASGHLAAGMLGIGLGKWPGFLRDAADRAGAFQSNDGRVLLAQATTNTATDASGGRTVATAPPAPPGRYVADNPRSFVGGPSIGDGECVPLVQQATGAPRTAQWRPGVPVQGNPAIRQGTAIATFDANGHYSGHAAIYLDQDTNGIRVVDQWNRRDANGNVSSQRAPDVRTLPFNQQHQHSVVDRGESYRVIE